MGSYGNLEYEGLKKKQTINAHGKNFIRKRLLQQSFPRKFVTEWNLDF